MSLHFFASVPALSFGAKPKEVLPQDLPKLPPAKADRLEIRQTTVSPDLSPQEMKALVERLSAYEPSRLLEVAAQLAEAAETGNQPVQAALLQSLYTRDPAEAMHLQAQVKAGAIEPIETQPVSPTFPAMEQWMKHNPEVSTLIGPTVTTLGLMITIFLGTMNLNRGRIRNQEERLGEKKLQQKAVQDDPTDKDLTNLRKIRNFALKCLENPEGAAVDAIKKRQMERLAANTLNAIAKRQGFGNDWDVAALAKIGVSLATLQVVNVDAPAIFPERNRIYNWAAKALTWLGQEERAQALISWRTHRTAKKRALAGAEERRRIEKQYPPVERAHWENFDFRNGTPTGFNVSHGNLKNTRFDKALVLLWTLTGADMHLAEAPDSRWVKCAIEGAKLYGVKMPNSQWYALEGEKADFRPYAQKNPKKPDRSRVSDLQGMRINNLDFDPQIQCFVMGTNDLRGADFREANLQRSNWKELNLQKANLQEANLDGATWRNVDPRGANFRGATMTHMTFPEKIRVLEEQLTLNNVEQREDQEFREDDCQQIEFDQADLSHTTWAGSDLHPERTKFKGANLSGANFKGSQIEGTDLSQFCEEVISGNLTSPKRFLKVFGGCTWQEGDPPVFLYTKEHPFNQILLRRIQPQLPDRKVR
jgi:uncharacterized protein YjbI with pentapeptide repeats